MRSSPYPLPVGEADGDSRRGGKSPDLGHYEMTSETTAGKEEMLFGGDGFEEMVARVAEVEKKLGLYDLAQFTPKI